MRLTDFWWLFAGVSLNAGAQLGLKAATRSTGRIDSGASNLWQAGQQLAVTPAFWLALAAYGVSVAVWTVGLSRVPVSQAYPVLSLGYVLTALNGNWQSDLNIAAVSTGPLTIDFDMYELTNSTTEWGACSLRAPGSAFPVAGATEFGFLRRRNGGVQVFQNGNVSGTASWDTANFALAPHWTLIFTDTAGTGSAFNGNGSKVTMINGTLWTNTLTLAQLKRSGLKLGFNASVDKGPWTWAVALVHGFGKINSSRDTGFGIASADYNAHLDGALTELSYYWSLEQNRIVPKAAFEYVRATTGSLQEFGGLDPVAASSATAERARLLIGAEIGRYWIFDRKIFDLSAYGKFVDNVAQNFNSVTVSLGAESITVQGVGESRYGADAGASASLSLSNTARLYLNYDGKFRAAMQSHQGTAGVELKW